MLTSSMLLRKPRGLCSVTGSASACLYARWQRHIGRQSAPSLLLSGGGRRRLPASTLASCGGGRGGGSGGCGSGGGSSDDFGGGRGLSFRVLGSCGGVNSVGG